MVRWPGRLPIPKWGSFCSMSSSVMAGLPLPPGLLFRFFVPFCVGAPGIGNGPLTLIGNLAPLSDLALPPGRSAAVCDRQIVIGNSIRLVLDESERWRAPPWPNRPSPARLIETCAALARRAAID